MTDPLPVPDDLTADEKHRLALWIRARDYPLGMRTNVAVQETIDACLDWHGARANPGKIVDWYRAVCAWIRKEQKFQREKQGVDLDAVQIKGVRDDDFEPIGPLLANVIEMEK